MAVETNRTVNPKRILTIKFSSIGDIVLTTSPLQSLKKIFPSAEIDFLTLNDYSSILEGNKYIDRIIPFDRNSGLIQLIKTGNWISKSPYDLVIDFHSSLRSKIIRFWIRNIPIIYLKKPRWKRFLLFRFRRNYFTSDFTQLKLLHKPISKWMSSNKYPLPKLFISEIEKKQVGTYLKEMGVQKPYITIIPGAAWSQKRWLVANYCKLLNDLKNHGNINFVILGGKADDICSEIEKCDSTFINLKGKTSLRESMAIMANSKFVIGADTGLVHAAEALGKRVVSIIGPTSRETGAGVNRNDSILIENNNIWCRPCSQTGKRKCYRDEQYCMTSITPQFVSSKVLEGGLL